MKLSLAAEFAVRGVLVLAGEDSPEPVNLDTICNRRDLPKQYLAKIFGLLARADIVTPVRGKHGGYLIARPLDKITVLEIIEAVEGPIILNLCQHAPPKCDHTGCALRSVWTELQKIFREKLGGVTLQDCVGKK